MFIHQFECDLIGKACDEQPFGQLTLSHITLIRMLALNQADDQGFATRIKELTSHVDNFLDNSEWASSFTEMCDLIISSGQNNEPLLVHQLLGILLVNFIDHTNKYNENIGYSFDPEFSLINHSCVSNTVMVPFNNQTFCLMATRPIGKESQIFTTYIHPGIPRVLRQHELNSRYFFRCVCSSCSLSFDWFFSYNCVRCNHVIYNLDLHTFHQLTIEQLFQNMSMQCRHCQNTISRKLYQKVFQAHQLLFSMMFSDDVIPPITNYPTTSLGYELTDTIATKVSNIITVLETSPQVVPLFCYPLNIYVNTMASWTHGSRNDNGVESMMEWAKWEFKRVFSVIIPSDISQLRFLCNFHYVAVADCLVELFCFMMENSPKDTSMDDDYDMALIVFKCAIFFYLQALESYTRRILDNNIREMARDIISKINFMFRIDTENSTANLQQFQSLNPSSYCQNMFVKEVHLILKLFQVQVQIHKHNQLKMCFADRARCTLFESIDELHCKSFFS
ncbi:uncharacterized protein KQ657_005211 [Scheffersomyces spartinae]|uniref:SET domain-containing protein n=1 Tax=Scheffersomyces spartinae TaxID=45513 RepID=A0A9P8AJC3_9ASCO|nr:uncharacterized protein KQ657_005211 [Scheffersomyces spartinae]KAG7194012.1 hypothetical protein KQ657_005211 [Scheffersomyces spartinae]